MKIYKLYKGTLPPYFFSLDWKVSLYSLYLHISFKIARSPGKHRSYRRMGSLFWLRWHQKWTFQVERKDIWYWSEILKLKIHVHLSPTKKEMRVFVVIKCKQSYLSIKVKVTFGRSVISGVWVQEGTKFDSHLKHLVWHSVYDIVQATHITIMGYKFEQSAPQIMFGWIDAK